jgi:hypothetical protein
MVRTIRFLGGKVKPTPARVTTSEKQDVLHRLDRKIASVNHRYAFQIKHGGSTDKKQRTKSELQMLENEHKSVERMQPVPGHVRRAERMS